MKKALSLFLTVMMMVLLAACGGGGEKKAADAKPAEGGGEEQKDAIVIKFSHVTSADSVKGKAAQKFADLAAEKTGGKVKVEVYPSSQLYGDKEELDALVSGNVQMIAPSVTKMVKLDPRWQYVDMPFLFKDREHSLKFFQSDLAKQLLNGEQLVGNDIMGLAFWENGFKQFTNNKKPLKAPADFKGLKFRAQAGKVLEGQFKALGAGSATIPFGDTYAALQQGTVDGQENTYNNMDTQKYQEVQKYMTISNHGRLDYAIFVNKSFWDGMPEDVRTKVEEALKEATEYEWKLAAEDNDKSYENLKNSGKMEITELTDAERAELEKALQPVYEEFKSVITPELIDGIKNMK
ncbi:DctP family TRAP transporter solute-binding subunit [Aneurinibacillus aneurinilyticus]|nr:DctP family TRAP transporter solute-binding subunit [Aneurinibacillus aneurinilyticus]MCI1696224.1 DctP family TRAP transporter solute-binding subunit [Aneurinibacillus aneurinilyticus]MED0672142.1 DctP family TRAP transporter solute-binding subunit [Aneurinibacillus aneurinilyticus]MED0706791.1 DctP family TRAP transporter solute-binding subunit [Aneurinibacillus aneurinilyticus]MED0723789.1 DctP family TRAP transporter solute-binding subunit [Aneurinibacillus aneurinilyticus]MED0730299.1 